MLKKNVLRDLDNLGYCINNETIHNKDSGRKFDLSFERNALSELKILVQRYVHAVLIEELGMDVLPLGSEELRGSALCTENFHEKTCAMILINCSRSCSAGVWSLNSIIKNSLVEGSQIPYIKDAIRNELAVLTVSKNMEEIWEKFIEPSCMKSIAIVAHWEYPGGNAALKFMEKESAKELIKKVALINSQHSSVRWMENWKARDFAMENCRHWIPSSSNVGVEIANCQVEAAETSDAELVCSVAQKSVLTFVMEMVKESGTKCMATTNYVKQSDVERSMEKVRAFSRKIEEGGKNISSRNDPSCEQNTEQHTPRR